MLLQGILGRENRKSMNIKLNLRRRIFAVVLAALILLGGIFATVLVQSSKDKHQTCSGPLHGLTVRTPKGWRMQYLIRGQVYIIRPPKRIFSTNDTSIQIWVGGIYSANSSPDRLRENYGDLSDAGESRAWGFTTLTETQNPVLYERGNYLVAKASFATGTTIRQEDDLWWRPVPQYESFDSYWIVSSVEGEGTSVEVEVFKGAGEARYYSEVDKIVESLEFTGYDPSFADEYSAGEYWMDCELIEDSN